MHRPAMRLEWGLIIGGEHGNNISCGREQIAASICSEDILQDFLSLKGLRGLIRIYVKFKLSRGLFTVFCRNINVQTCE
jgi:hypothetical protein